MQTYQQINLRLHPKTKARFDAVCRRAGQSSTAILRSLIDAHIENAADALEVHQRRMKAIDEEIARHPRLVSFREFVASRDPQPGGRG